MRATSAPAMIRPAGIRQARPDDAEALYEICLRTGSNGADATDRYTDRRLLGHVYVGPYLALQPELAFVLADRIGPCGYVLGALDTAAFEKECEARWWPPLRMRYADPGTWPDSPDGRLAYLIHHPAATPSVITESFPSHLHIDLLPRARGAGHGRAMIERLLSALVAARSSGVHLGVSSANTRAVGFYRHLGFAELRHSPTGAIMARPLS